MKDQLVPVKNIARLTQLMTTLQNRAPGAPNIGIIDGIPGVGKTNGSLWLMAKQDGVFLRALGISSPRSILESYCRDLDITPLGSNAKTLDAVVQKLIQEKRPTFIDEADKIVRLPKVIETVRDIADMSRQPHALIGEGALQRKIQAIPRLSSRILAVADFQGLDDADARLVAKSLCEVVIADDLVEDINRKAKGLIRLLVVALHKAEGIAHAEDKKSLHLKDWPASTPYFLNDTSVRPKVR